MNEVTIELYEKALARQEARIAELEAALDEILTDYDNGGVSIAAIRKARTALKPQWDADTILKREG